MTTNKLVIYVLGKKGLRVLEAIVEAKQAQSILAVVYATDTAVQNDYAVEIQTLCSKAGVSIHFKNDEAAKKLQSEYALAVGWRWLIKEEQHNQVIVFHDSLLPKYRGFAPLVAQLIKGEKTLGVTALIASSDYDKGPIISQESTDIDYPIKVGDAIDAIIPCYQNQALQVLSAIVAGTELNGREQNETEATYSVWRDEEDLRVDWSENSSKIERFVNATGFPFSGAFTMLDGNRIVINEVRVVEDLNLEFRHVGKTIRFDGNVPVVICGVGLVSITSAHWYDSGEKIMKWPRFRLRFK